MRAQFADLFTVTFVVIMLIFIVGPSALKYLGNPHDNFIEFMIVNIFKSYIGLVINIDDGTSHLITKDTLMEMVENWPLVEYIDKNLWDFIAGIVNLLKITIFIFITGYILTHIWQWCSVLGITAKR